MLTITSIALSVSSLAFAQDSFQASCGDAETPNLCFVLGATQEGGTALISVDLTTGILCDSDRFELEAHSVYGMSVEGEDAYVCSADELYRIAMDSPGAEPLGVSCAGVIASPDVAGYDDAMDALSLFDNGAALLAGAEPIASVRTPPHSTRYTFDGTTLYTSWHVGPRIGLYTWNASESLGELELEDFEGWVWGIYATATDLLVLTDGREASEGGFDPETGARRAELVGFDPESGARRSSLPLDLPGVIGYYGLWCTGE